jgi:hypothetical protein
MPKFVIEREIPGAGNLTDAELQAISRKSVEVLKSMGPEIQWLQSYVTGDKVYCACISPPMRPWFASTQNAAASPPIAFPPFAV